VDKVLARLDTVEVWNSTWGPDHTRQMYQDRVRMLPIEAKFVLQSGHLKYPGGKAFIN